MYGTNRNGFPGVLAPMYQDLVLVRRVVLATSSTCWVHSCSASAVGSIRVTPFSLAWLRQPTIHSMCCSIEVGMLLSTEGLPGPVIMNRFGKPLVARPR